MPGEDLSLKSFECTKAPLGLKLFLNLAVMGEAGLAVGFWSSRDEIGKAYRAGKRFEPKMKPEERERHLAKWRRAVSAA